MSLSNLASMIAGGLRSWCSMIWSGIMSIFFIIGSIFQHSPLAVIEQKATEVIHEPQHTTTTVQDQKDAQSNIVYVPSPSPAVDESKLIEKISAIVRAKVDQDLKIKLEKELKSLTASYEQKLSNLKVEKHRTDVDYAHLESLIRSAIYEYDSDKTGMFDFALESAGASIISTRCSENYDTYTRLEKIWNIPLWYSSYGPRTVIQRNSKTLFPGECWSFKGPVGYITIGLSHPINVTIVSYEHIGAHQAPGGERPSAPKTFKIWAYKSESDMSSRVLLGDFMYDIKGSPLQFFVIKVSTSSSNPGYAYML
ncbi:Sad1 / UNC-like protein [Ostertagia ostertagi]